MPFTFTSTGGSGEGTPGKDSLFLGTWNSVTEFLAVHQGGPVGLADGDWWAFVKDNENPNKVYVVREDTNSATGWVIDNNEHFILPAGADGADGSGSADIADFIFTNDVESGLSIISLPGDKRMRIEAGADSDLYITAGDDIYIETLGAGDDIHLNAADDIRFTTNNEDNEFETVPQWTMNSEGQLHLPGRGYIENPTNSSGDGSGNDTLKLVPDEALIWNGGDQYIIVDPTAPNHIHVRAGGTQDDSSADLFLGGELNHVRVSDNGRNVSITSRPAAVNNTYTNLNPTGNTFFVVSNTANIYVGDTAIYPGDGTIITVDSVTADSPEAGLQTITANLNGTPTIFVTGDDYYFTHNSELNNYWEFRSDGTLSGPSMGGLKVLGLLNSGNYDLGLYANDADIILQAASGKVDIIAPEVNIVSNVVPSSFNINTYLGASVNSNRTSTYAVEDKVVATLGDLPTGATGTFMSSDNQLITVTNGIITTINSLT